MQEDEEMKIIIYVIILVFLQSCSSANSYGKQMEQIKDTGIDRFAPKYKRSSWKHWIDEDRNCLDTRHDILKKRSERDVIISKRGKKCYVKTGLWSDYYYPEKLTTAKEVDIDHLIPLKHAHDIGGWKWDQNLKKKFANDPENLVITNKRYNRIKGAKKINEWLPLNIEYACKYYKDWMKIKQKYNLPVSEEESNAVDIGRCN